MPNDIPRVSAILKLLFPHALDFVDESALLRGARLHFAMECYVNDRLYGFPPTIIPEIQPMVDWLEREEVEFEAAEARVEHPTYRYCGHEDLRGRWRGTPCVFDYKFAESISTQNLVQLEAYRQVHTPKRQTVLLQCPRDGRVRPQIIKPHAAHWAIFLSALNVWHFHRAQHPKEVQSHVK